MFSSALSGLLTGYSLLFAIGAQNAFVLRQGLKGEHVLWLVLFCSISDAVLITFGVTAFGTLVSFYPGLPRFMVVAGAAFLVIYGAARFWAAWRGAYEIIDGSEARTLGRTLALAAAFTWANPHVYLDTVTVIGAISTGYAGAARWAFGIGAVAASFMFFFPLGFGARLLAPAMRSPRAWRYLDTLMGLVMWWLAAGLLSRL